TMDVLMVEFSRSLRDQEHRRAVTLWHEAIRRVSLITLPFFGYLLFMADRVITLLYTDAYAESAIPFRIYLFLILVRVTRYGDIFMAAGQTSFIFYSSVFFVLVTGVCGVLGIKFLGFVGPPLAAVVSRYLLVLVMLLKVRRLLRVNLRQIMPWKVLARNLAVALGAGMLVFPLSFLPWPDISVVALSSALYFGLYVGGAWWKLVTEADLSILSRWMFLDRLGLHLPPLGRRR
ncbi:MAG TPA: hypothetical protein EYP49_13210, partial [Anaerolineae bacterium]|nr:hypothetical protein [Anaerolineae bacterium]